MHINPRRIRLLRKDFVKIRYMYWYGMNHIALDRSDTIEDSAGNVKGQLLIRWNSAIKNISFLIENLRLLKATSMLETKCVGGNFGIFVTDWRVADWFNTLKMKKKLTNIMISQTSLICQYHKLISHTCNSIIFNQIIW